MKHAPATLLLAGCAVLCAHTSLAQELKAPEGLSAAESTAVAMCIAFLENEGAARAIGETTTGWKNLGSKSPVPSLYGIMEYEHSESGLSVYATRESFDLRETHYCGIIQFDPQQPLNMDGLNALGMTVGSMEANSKGEIRTWSLEKGDVKYMMLAGVQPDTNEINFFKHSN